MGKLKSLVLGAATAAAITLGGCSCNSNNPAATQEPELPDTTDGPRYGWVCDGVWHPVPCEVLHNCELGERYRDGACTLDCSLTINSNNPMCTGEVPPVEPTCTEGQVLSNGECVTDCEHIMNTFHPECLMEPEPTCEVGQKPSNGECVTDCEHIMNTYHPECLAGPIEPTCGVGQVIVNGECVIDCENPINAQNQACIVEPIEPTCPTGQVLSNGECVIDCMNLINVNDVMCLVPEQRAIAEIENIIVQIFNECASDSKMDEIMQYALAELEYFSSFSGHAHLDHSLGGDFHTQFVRHGLSWCVLQGVSDSVNLRLSNGDVGFSFVSDIEHHTDGTISSARLKALHVGEPVCKLIPDDRVYRPPGVPDLYVQVFRHNIGLAGPTDVSTYASPSSNLNFYTEYVNGGIQNVECDVQEHLID